MTGVEATASLANCQVFCAVNMLWSRGTAGAAEFGGTHVRGRLVAHERVARRPDPLRRGCGSR